MRQAQIHVEASQAPKRDYATGEELPHGRRTKDFVCKNQPSVLVFHLCCFLTAAATSSSRLLCTLSTLNLTSFFIQSVGKVFSSSCTTSFASRSRFVLRKDVFASALATVGSGAALTSGFDSGTAALASTFGSATSALAFGSATSALGSVSGAALASALAAV